MRLILTCLLITFISPATHAQLVAFPGAEGVGAWPPADAAATSTM